jgi:hypothetical protein
MNEERFDELMRDAAPSYNRPPDLPPLDEIWDSIEQARQREANTASWFQGHKPQRRGLLSQPWLRRAAILVVGVALGRASIVLLPNRTALQEPAASDAPVATAPVTAPARSAHQRDTDQYLGQAAALLISLPGELNAPRGDGSYARRADDLLLQTRMLLDSPAASDPVLRSLFEDLEMILVQVIRLKADPDPTRIDLLNDALEQRDLIPRLRDAVVDHIAD